MYPPSLTLHTKRYKLWALLHRGKMNHIPMATDNNRNCVVCLCLFLKIYRHTKLLSQAGSLWEGSMTTIKTAFPLWIRKPLGEETHVNVYCQCRTVFLCLQSSVCHVLWANSQVVRGWSAGLCFPLFLFGQYITHFYPQLKWSRTTSVSLCFISSSKKCVI